MNDSESCDEGLSHNGHFFMCPDLEPLTKHATRQILTRESQINEMLNPS
jgi:hypothetical protein